MRRPHLDRPLKDRRTSVNPDLEYAGEALTLALVGFRLLRWAWGAVSEGDAPPSAELGNPVAIGAGLTGSAEDGLAAMVAGSAPSHATGAGLESVDPSQLVADPALFPPEMLAAMTPEQRTHVLETLARQREAQTKPAV
jgi:hypothetical protein